MNEKQDCISNLRSYYKKFKDLSQDLEDTKRRNKERTNAYIAASNKIRALKNELETEEEALKDVIGTSEEDALVKKVESLKAQLQKATDRSTALKKVADELESVYTPVRSRLEKKRNLRIALFRQMMGVIAENELKAFPLEARRVLVRAYSVAVQSNMDWDTVIKDLLAMPSNNAEIGKIGEDVVAEYFSELEARD